jgi:exo-beta-1,3-glucanase (GH17 family)
MAVSLFSCTEKSPTADITREDLRPLPAEFSTLKPICYSGYRTGQSPGTEVYPSEAEILEDLNILIEGGWGLIRLYDCSTHGERVLKVIDDNNLDLKVLLGVWISGSIEDADTDNMEQCDKAIELAGTYSDIVLAVSVGNETLVDWSAIAIPPADLVVYIEYVRDGITQPVTTDDNWEPFYMRHEDGSAYDTLQVIEALDFVTIHTYPLWDSNYSLWDWKQEDVSETERAEAMMDAAIEYAQGNYNSVRTALANAGASTLPIVIGETGWTDAGFPYRGHAVNQKMYYDRLMDWVYGSGQTSGGPVACFYFEAFNEPWKGGDDNWGLFNVDREAKYVLWEAMPSYKPAGAPDLTDDDALYYVPPTSNGTITEETYVVYAESYEEGEAHAPLDPASSEPMFRWDAWENGTTATGAYIDTDPATPEGTEVHRITPTPLVWGWGMAANPDSAEDLSNFSNGHLVFEIKTTYSGKIEVGFMTGTTVQSTACDVYLTINPASNTYGYSNDGNWHTVSIPIATIRAQAAPAYGMPGSAVLNMAQVSSTFVIADRYAKTGNTSPNNAAILVDDIRWTQD